MLFPELHRKEVNSMKASPAFLKGLFRRISKRRHKKVFIIGFHKTGTSSLGKALQILGYKVCGSLKEAHNYDNQQDMKSFLLKTASPLLNRYDAFQDTPWFLLYKELYERYPDAYFILTKRPTELWINSVQKHFGNQTFKFHDYIYGTNDSFNDSTQYVKVYENHNISVEHFFSNKGNFLQFDVSRDGWDQLVTFLKVKKPTSKFPHANEAKYRSRTLTKVKKLIKKLYYKNKSL